MYGLPPLPYLPSSNTQAPVGPLKRTLATLIILNVFSIQIVNTRSIGIYDDALLVAPIGLFEGDFDDVVRGVCWDDYFHSKVAVTELIVKWGLSGK